MTALEIFVRNVRMLMTAKGMRVKDLAELIGVSESYLSLVLNNARDNIHDQLKDRIAAVFDTTVADLYTEVHPSIVEDRPQDGREEGTRSLEDFLTVLGLDEPAQQLPFYRHYNRLSDAEAGMVARFLRGVLEDLAHESRVLGTDFGEGLTSGKGPAADSGPEPSEPDPAWLVRRLPPLERDLLELLAVAGGQMAMSDLAKILNLEVGAMENVALELVERGLIRFLEHGEDSHPASELRVLDPGSVPGPLLWLEYRLWRHQLYTLIPLARRRQWHLRLARLLEEKIPRPNSQVLPTQGDISPLGEAMAFQRLKETAEHYARAGYGSKAFPLLLEAGDGAKRQGLFREALHYYRQALSFLKPSAAPLDRLEVEQRLSLTYAALHRWERVAEQQEKILGYLAGEKNTSSAIQARYLLGVARSHLYQYPQALAELDKAREMAAGRDEATRARIELALGQLHLGRGSYERAHRHLEEGVKLGERLGLESFICEGWAGLGGAALAQRQLQEAVHYLQRGLALAKRLQNSQLILSLEVPLSKAYRQLGDLQQAEELLSAARRRTTESSDLRTQALVEREMALLRSEKGYGGEARALLERSLSFFRQERDEVELARTHLVLARLTRLGRAPLEEARRSLQFSLAVFEKKGLVPDWAEALREMGELSRTQGNEAVAAVYLRQSRQLLERAEEGGGRRKGKPA